MWKTFCCVCGKVFLTKIDPQTVLPYSFCSDECWNNAPASLPNKET